MTVPWLCRFGIHRWRFLEPGGLGTGCYEQCRRCGRFRFLSFLGGYIYVDPEP
jgi:hypothetical protein